MAALTFLEVQKLTAEYGGRGGLCVGTPEAETFARRVMEYIMLLGAYGSIRRFHFKAFKGCIALPPELEVPLQVKVDGRVGTVWNQWMTFQSVTCDLEAPCSPATKALKVLPDPVYTAYPVPAGGSILAVLSTCDERDDSSIVIKSKDITGREIITDYRGEQAVGEKFTSLKKNTLKYGKAIHGTITGIVKSKTYGYVQLWAVNPQTGSGIFLADYSPLEETPQYTGAEVIGCNCNGVVDVVVQGRIRLKQNYAANDIVPFDSMNTITFAAQKIQAEANNNVQLAGYKGNLVKEMIEDEAAYKRVSPGSPVNTFAPLSGGAVKGIVRYRIG